IQLRMLVERGDIAIIVSKKVTMPVEKRWDIRMGCVKCAECLKETSKEVLSSNAINFRIILASCLSDVKDSVQYQWFRKTEGYFIVRLYYGNRLQHQDFAWVYENGEWVVDPPDTVQVETCECDGCRLDKKHFKSFNGVLMFVRPSFKRSIEKEYEAVLKVDHSIPSYFSKG
ncbi:MAG TPA: hypothetical protein VJ044_04720, partial [Candidatus Hodarchaeales archaeon]|nr:hypothetical protein [Candidatus Hodarchaeales archaeon]